MKYNYLNWILFICLLFMGINIPTHLFSQWEKELVGFGARGSVAPDTTGNIHLFFLSEPYDGDLVYAFRQEDQWIKDTLVRSGIVTQCEAVVDKDNILHVAYVEADWNINAFTLKYMFNGGTGWSTPETVTSTEWGITAVSLGVDVDGYLHLGYIHTNNIGSAGPLIYLHNSSGTWQEEVVSGLYEEYAYSDASMAVDDAGYAHFAFYNMPGGPAYQTNAPDGVWSDVISVQDNWSGGQMERMVIDIAVDSEGIPHISYVGSDDGEPLENHRYATKAGAGWITEHVDSGDWFSGGHAIAVDSSGNSHMAYYHLKSDELRYAMNATGSWAHEILDTCESTEGSLDIAIDAEGYAHICYQQNPENIWYVTNHVEVPAPQIALSPENLSFGTIDTGQVAIDSVCIKNYGVLDLHIQDIQLTGGDSAEFSIEHSCSTIAPGDSCKVQVTFAPDSMGYKQITLKITSDDPDTPVAEAVITGRTPAPVIQVDPGDLVFDLTEVGGTDSLGLTIKNAGDRDLEIHSLKLSGENSGEFDYQSACGTISPDDSCEIEVIFVPESPGTKSATLDIYSNDPDNPELTVSLDGRTPAAHIEIQAEVLDFGTVPVGNLVTEQIILENSGERQLNISALTISGTNASLFHASNTCGVISPEGSCPVDITFHPTSEGPKTAVLTISSNDPDRPESTLTLQGTGGERQTLAMGLGTEKQDKLFAVEAISGGGFLVGGQTGGDGWLAKITGQGDIAWQKVFDNGLDNDAIFAIRETWDGGFIVGGRIFADQNPSYGNGVMWLARLDSNGNILWQKHSFTPDDSHPDQFEAINDILITSDHHFVAVGEWWPDHVFGMIWIGKFDDTGTNQWEKSISHDFSKPGDLARGCLSIMETGSGDYIIAGADTNKSISGNYYEFIPNATVKAHPDGGFLYGGGQGGVCKVASDGDVLWEKQIKIHSSQNFWLTHVTFDSEILWQKEYSQSNEPEFLYDVAVSEAGNIFLLCSVQHPEQDEPGHRVTRVMKLTKTGDIIWQKDFVTPYLQEGMALTVDAAGSVLIVGYYENGDQGTDGWICRLSPDGRLEGCSSDFLESGSASPSPGTGTLSDIVDDYIYLDANGFRNASVSTSDAAAASRTFCSGIVTDMDYDGVDDTEESGPEGQDGNYDGNNDGLPDSQQSNVTSFHTYDGTEYVTIETPAGIKFQDVSAEDNPSPEDQPEDFEFPIGFFDFTLTGTDTAGSAAVTLHIPDDMAPETYYKYATTQDNPDPHWYEFLYDGETGAEIKQDRIILHFVDGARGDEDLAENGAIKDIGGPAIQKEVIGITQPDSLAFSKGATNYPNPFRGSTQIGFDLPDPVHVKIEIYDLLGHKIKTLINKRMAPGYHEVEFRPESLSPGVYFFRIEAGAYKDTQKMIFMK